MQLLPACVVFIISLGTVGGGTCSDPDEEQEADELEAEAGERLQLISCESLPIVFVLMVSLGSTPTPAPATEEATPPTVASVPVVVVVVATTLAVAVLLGLLQLLLLVDSPPPPPPPPASGILIISLGTTLLTRSSLAARIVSLGTICGNCCWSCSSSAHDDDEQEEDASELTAATSCGCFNDLIVNLGTKPSCDCCCCACCCGCCDVDAEEHDEEDVGICVGSCMRNGSTRRSSLPLPAGDSLMLLLLLPYLESFKIIL